jgi:integrase/recombinase XerD
MKLAITNTNQVLPTRQAETDAQVVELWLHGRSHHTQRAYRTNMKRIATLVSKPFHDVTLSDLQAFADTLTSSRLAPASVHRSLSAIKSLFSFAHGLGYLPFDVAKPLRLPGFRDGLADRILEEGDVQRMLALEKHPRNHVLLTILYAAGLRVSELCSLKWAHLQSRNEAGQITVCGKRDKTRTILLPTSVWNKLQTLRANSLDEAPVFRSRKKGHLAPSHVWRIVRKAARRAGITKDVSCHWLRHGHASHALDRGAPISLVQATLGHASIATTGRYLHARPTESSSTYLPL